MSHPLKNLLLILRHQEGASQLVEHGAKHFTPVQQADFRPELSAKCLPQSWQGDKDFLKIGFTSVLSYYEDGGCGCAVRLRLQDSLPMIPTDAQRKLAEAHLKPKRDHVSWNE